MRKFRKNLKDKSFQFTKDDLRDIEQVRSYLQSIIKRIGMYNNHYYRVEECDTSIIPNYRVEECDTSIIPTELLNNKVNGSFHFQESKKLRKHREKYIKLQQSKAKIACESDLNELEILSQRENIKLAKEAADYVISPLLGYSSRAAKNKQISEEDKEVINGVVAKADQVKNDLEKNVKPFTTEEIISPSTEFINPIAKLREKVLRRVG